MTNDLVPERRADKNGVVSTKWVRPVAGGSSAARVPAPLAPAAVEDWESLAGSPIAEVFGESWLGRKAKVSLRQFDYEAVCIINELLERKPDLAQEPERVFNEADEKLMDEAFVGDPFLPLNEVAVFAEVVLRPYALTDELVPLVNGLSAYFGAGRDYLHGVTVEERAAAVALVTVVTSLENHDFIDFEEVGEGEYEPYLGEFRSIALRSPELAELVMAHPAEAGEIVRIINERDSDDPGMVGTVLGSGHRSLNTGML